MVEIFLIALLTFPGSGMIIKNHVGFTVFQETTITEIKQKIMKIPEASGIVIDGFPRDVGQALSFEDQVSFCQRIQK